jgi:hypothetical protein
MPPASGPIRVKVKKRKPTVVKPPHGDVASSGADYGKRKAAPTVKRELHTIKVRQHQTKDVKSDADLGRAKTYHKAHPEILKPPKKKKKGGFFNAALSTVAGVAAPELIGTAAASDKFLGTHILPGAKKAVSNAPKDAADIAVSTPTSVAKLASDVVHRPEKVPGELIAPYKELVKHPGKFITEKPVSTLLMVAPVGRGPGLAAGKVARVAGKQTLERTAATLPRTALKESRIGSKDVVVRKLQSRADKKAGERTMTVRQVQKRVDESFGAQQKHRDRIEHAIQRKVKVQAKALPKGERQAFLTEQRTAAKGAAKAQAHREYGKEFGATAHFVESSTPTGPHVMYHVVRDTGTAAETKLARIREEGLRATNGAGATYVWDNLKRAQEYASMPGDRILAIDTRGLHVRGEGATRTIEGGIPRKHITFPDAPKRVLVKPKKAREGALHDSQADAQAVADALNRKPVTLKHGGFSKVEKVLPLARKPVQVKFVVSKVGEKHAVLPDIVSQRLAKHGGVGTSKAPGAKLLRQSRGMFTRAVLPYRPTWLSGQAIEGTLRAATQGAGPTSYLRARKLKAADPEMYKQLSDRAVPAGKIGKVMKEFAGERKSLADEFPGNPVAHALTQLGKAPGVKQVRDLHHAISSAVFSHVNAQALEAFPQTVMLGRALKKSPLMERRIIGLSDKAIEEAARGLRETPAQVALARDVQRAYGKYSNFGPALREAIVHWTPFIPWTLNAVKFLTSVLPKDHPVLSALIADADAATEDWRKAHRLSLRDKNQLPFFDQGGYPTQGGKSVLRIGHYTPFGVAVDPTGGLASMVLPQFTGAYGALKYGVDWKGQPLRHKDGSPYSAAETWLYGLQQLGEAMIPVAQQTQDIATSGHPLKTVQHELRVLSSTRVKPKTKVKVKSGDGFGGPSTSKGDGFGPAKSSKKGDGFGG